MRKLPIAVLAALLASPAAAAPAPTGAACEFRDETVARLFGATNDAAHARAALAVGNAGEAETRLRSAADALKAERSHVAREGKRQLASALDQCAVPGPGLRRAEAALGIDLRQLGELRQRQFAQAGAGRAQARQGA